MAEQPQAIPYRYGKYSVGGKEYVDAFASTNLPHSYQEIDYNTFEGMAKNQYLPESYGQGVSYYDYLSKHPTLKNALTGGPSEYVIDPVTGNQTTAKAINETAANEAAVAAGTMTKVPIGSGFGYVPTGSAGEKLTTALQTGQVSLNDPMGQFNVSMTGNNVANAGIVPQAPTQPMKQALELAKASGAAPQDSAQGRAAVQGFMPPQQPDTSGIDMLLSEDKAYAQYLKDYADAISTEGKRSSLTEDYQKLLKDSGIQGIDTQLMNMKNVIEGTEDDLRAEITKAGGFATDSQIMALTAARNKTLIKDYNRLQDTRKNLQDNLNTMMSLNEKDRELASQLIDKKLDYDRQVIQFVERASNNAREGFNRIIQAVGYEGLAQMAGGDPYYTSLIEKSLGLQAGGLQDLVQAKKLQSNRELMMDIPTPFGNKQGEFIDRNGEAFATPEDFFRAAGVKSFEEAYQKGLVTDINAPSSLKSSDTQVVTAGGRSLLINKITGETIRDLGGAYKTGSSSGSSTSSGGISPKTDTAAEVKAWILDNKRKNPNVAYYDLWGQLAEELTNSGLNPSNFDKQFWEILHPDGLAGYEAEKKKTKTTSDPLDELINSRINQAIGG